MDGVISCSKELNKRLLECDIYKDYICAKNELLKYPQYKEMADRFRRKQVELEARKTNGVKIDINEELALSNEYADICLIAVCNNFFQAEMQLLEALKNVYAQICDGLLIDMDFMNMG